MRVFVVLCASFVISSVQAQQEPPAQPPPQEESEEVRALRERVEALEARLELQAVLAEEAAPPPAPPALPDLPNALNPRLTIFADAIGRLDNRRVFGGAHGHGGEEGPPVRLDDRFSLRETEVDFRAAVDPYVDGVLVLAVEQLPDGSFEPTLEEGYALIKRLPLPGLEVPPLGLLLKVGRFRADFGRVNQLHTHDLPQTTRPLVVEELLGQEGVLATGASAEVFLPLERLDPLSTLKLTLQVFTADLPLSEHRNAQLLGNLGWSRPLGDHHRVELSAIGHLGRPGGPVDGTVSADLLYAWRPSTFQGAILGAQGFLTRPADLGRDVRGAYVFGQWQFNRDLFAGVRYDWTEGLEEEPEVHQAIFPYLSWYPSEFFRTRLGYEHRPATDEDAALHTLWLQVTFLFGSHPPHPYWVHR